MYLTNKIRAINKVFGQLESHISSFQELSSISCAFNCGMCCHKNDIETTVIEFLPAAMSLYLSGESGKIFSQLENNPAGICVFYNPVGSEGYCSQYHNRGLVCRLFGFATKKGKKGIPSLVACKIIKQSLDPVLLEKTLKEAPEMVNYYMKLYSIDPSLSIQYFPINVSIRKAMEIVLFHFEYTKKSA
jgi:Fe-S-cluster containining protein